MKNQSYINTAQDQLHISLISIDMADGDILAGLMLDRLRFWSRPGKNGQMKTRVVRDGHRWIAKGRDEWFDECRLTARQADNAREKLEALGLIETRRWDFGGTIKLHFRLIEKACNELFTRIIEAQIEAGLYEEESESPNGESLAPPIHETVNPESPNGDTDSPNRESLNNVSTGITQDQLHDSAPDGEAKPRKHDAMFDAIVAVCLLNPKIDGSYIGRTKRDLKKMDKTTEDVIEFGQWWYEYDWRGKQGQAPTLNQLVIEIGKPRNMQPRQHNGRVRGAAQSQRAPMTPQLEDEINQALAAAERNRGQS